MNKLLLVLLIAMLPSLVFSQDQSEETQSDAQKWEFNITPYMSMASISGDISFLNQSLPVNDKLGLNLTTAGLCHWSKFSLLTT